MVFIIFLNVPKDFGMKLEELEILSCNHRELWGNVGKYGALGLLVAF